MRPVFAVMTVLLAGGIAQAQTRDRLAVGSLEIFGETGIPAERLARLRANLLGGFASVGWTVLSDREVKEKAGDNPALLSCQSDPCFKALGEAAGAQWVLAGSISVATSTSYSADLRLVDVASGQTAAKYSDSCGVCTSSEANNWLALVAADLKQKALATRPVAAANGTAAVATVKSEWPTTRKQLWIFRGAAIGSAALAVAGFIVGGVEASREGRLCTPVAPATDCPLYRDTATGQAFGFVTGSLFLAGAAVLAYYGWWHYRGRSLALVPGAAAGAVGLSGLVQF
jgi:hypothetical protein